MINEFWTKWQLWPKNVITQILQSLYNFISILACLGNDAEALRDILIHRLESQTESISLKVAILKFFTANAKTQPGLIQLLLSQEEGCLK